MGDNITVHKLLYKILLSTSALKDFNYLAFQSIEFEGT
jgi:hypothetical protein